MLKRLFNAFGRVPPQIVALITVTVSMFVATHCFPVHASVSSNIGKFTEVVPIMHPLPKVPVVANVRPVRGIIIVPRDCIENIDRCKK